jgi:hypothetical protein
MSNFLNTYYVPILFVLGFFTLAVVLKLKDMGRGKAIGKNLVQIGFAIDSGSKNQIIDELKHFPPLQDSFRMVISNIFSGQINGINWKIFDFYNRKKAMGHVGSSGQVSKTTVAYANIPATSFPQFILISKKIPFLSDFLEKGDDLHGHLNLIENQNFTISFRKDISNEEMLKAFFTPEAISYFQNMSEWISVAVYENKFVYYNYHSGQPKAKDICQFFSKAGEVLNLFIKI